MKTLHAKIACTLLLSIFSTALLAQKPLDDSTGKKSKEDLGYWVIESNVKTPKQSMIHYYKMDHSLVYSEPVTGRKLKVNNKKTLLMLKEKTNLAIDLYEKTAKNNSKKQLPIGTEHE